MSVKLIMQFGKRTIEDFSRTGPQGQGPNMQGQGLEITPQKSLRTRINITDLEYVIKVIIIIHSQSSFRLRNDAIIRPNFDEFCTTKQMLDKEREIIMMTGTFQPKLPNLINFVCH